MVNAARSVALLFPGQGAQYVGMGRDFYEDCPAGRALVDEANVRLGFDLSGLMFGGPEAELTETKNSQPALYVASLAAWEALRERLPDLRPAACAGLSLGEYTALTAAGALAFVDGLRLVRRRGEAMQSACETRGGAMASVIGLGEDECRRLCDTSRGEGILGIANVNAPDQIVVSGDRDAVARAVQGARAFGAKRAIELRVSGAFHSPLMEPARRQMEAALAGTTICAPRVPVVFNVSGGFESDPEEIRRLLARQVVESVRWWPSMQTLLTRGIDCVVEVGPGRVLQGLMRRISPEVAVVGVEDRPTLGAAVEALAAFISG